MHRKRVFIPTLSHKINYFVLQNFFEITLLCAFSINTLFKLLKCSRTSELRRRVHSPNHYCISNIYILPYVHVIYIQFLWDRGKKKVKLRNAFPEYAVKINGFKFEWNQNGNYISTSFENFFHCFCFYGYKLCVLSGNYCGKRKWVIYLYCKKQQAGDVMQKWVGKLNSIESGSAVIYTDCRTKFIKSALKGTWTKAIYNSSTQNLVDAHASFHDLHISTLHVWTTVQLFY